MDWYLPDLLILFYSQKKTNDVRLPDQPDWEQALATSEIQGGIPGYFLAATK